MLDNCICPLCYLYDLPTANFSTARAAQRAGFSLWDSLAGIPSSNN